MDVSRRREAADVADVMLAVADEVEVGIEQLFVLDALDDGEGTPGDVVVDSGDLPRPPDQPDDRERSVRLGVQRVADVLGRAIRGAAQRSTRQGSEGGSRS